MLKSALLVAALSVPVLAHADTPAIPEPKAVADGVWLIPGSFEGHWQPDGNTIIWQAPQGLIVMDTGRHTWHRQAILDFAKDHHQPVVAIINSHWHLDHTSGNADIKAAYPQARVYTSTAVLRMIRDFFPKGVADSQAYLKAHPELPPEQKADMQGDIDTRLHSDALRPDVPVTASGAQDLGGRVLNLDLARDAATDGDVWVYDSKTNIVASGDLITFPVPFADTACMKGWRDGLDAIWATPFTLLIPGHGEPMTRDQVLAYKTGFDAFDDCIKSAAETKTCADAWAAAVPAMQPAGAPADPRTAEMAGEYVDFLRENGGDAPRCETKVSASSQ